jgi:PAT family beta-lactamase induction signal transducer AmpG
MSTLDKKPSHPLLWVPTGYFTMALCYAMLTQVSVIMFKNLGLSNGQATAYASSLILAYTIKPVFAPIVEMYRSKKFFVLCAQTLVGLAFIGVGLAMRLPNYMVLLMPLFYVTSFIGATQDIASDGVYVTSLDTRSQSLYCGVQSLAWNIGPTVGNGALVYLSGWLHVHVFHHDPAAFGPQWMDAWRVIFLIVAGATLLMALWHWKVMPSGARVENAPRSVGEAAYVLKEAFVTFFQKKDIWKMVAFAFLYRTSVGLLEKVGPLFMMDSTAKGGLGLTNEQLGIFYGTYGQAAVVVGSLLGGMFVAKRGLKRSLMFLCITLNVPNLTFLAMAIAQPSSTLVMTIGVLTEKLTFGFGLVGYMIYMMQQLAPGKFQTTHYAFGTGLMALCNMLTGAASGYVEEYLGYVGFFVFVMVATIPSFLATWFAPFNHSDGVSEGDVKEVGGDGIPGSSPHQVS